jgi:membrane-bound serine protease (ClpP class)
MRKILAVLLLALLSIGLAMLPAQAKEPAAPATGAGPVFVIELKDTVNPGSADYLAAGLEAAAEAGAACAVIQLDTPGGLVDSMRAMVKAILASPVPVVVYVAPSGARAASAGAFLVLAAPIAAMAPATNIGAAHPVGSGGKDIKGIMGEKAVADLKAMIIGLAKRRGRDPEPAAKMVTDSASYDAGRAKELGLVDILAGDLGQLLLALEGRVVQTATGPMRIATKGKTLRFFEPSLRHKILSLFASPNLAYILLMIGLMGLYFELSNPGAVLPGVVGGLALILALFAMSALPISYTGLALIGLSVVLFIAEIYVVSGGVLAVGGAVALVLGSVMLFETDNELLKVSLSVLIPTVAAVVAFFGAVTWLAMRAQLKKASTGSEGLLGQRGLAVAEGQVRVMGELWKARSAQPLEPGHEVVVTKVDGLVLNVEPVEAARPEE